ncbi:hypothetical protein ACGFYA_20675 [Streptomyces sp. NPDC048305]|uniref:hypothetical protein n=1 Tax=Streptomyces sp. NPDC048305 TaxID=3365532 RepID=UPI003716C1E6
MKIRNPFKRTTVQTPELLVLPHPTLIVQHDDLTDALRELADVFGDGMTADHTGGAFSCGEADKIARVLALAGHREAAETWLSGHARGDEGDDYHFVSNDEDPEDEGRPLNDAEIAEYVTGMTSTPTVAELVELIGL